MFPNKSTPRLLQQQRPRHSDQQQQQAGSSDFQPKAGAPKREQQMGEQQMGEGSYEATRDYQKNIGDYLKKADVQKDAEAARPRSEAEAAELKKAEEEGRSHAKE